MMHPPEAISRADSSRPSSPLATPSARSQTGRDSYGPLTAGDSNASPSSSNASPLPAVGVVLIGTTATVRALWGQVEATCPGVVPSGCVLVEGAAVAVRGIGGGAWHGRVDDLPPILGTLDNLVELHARRRFKLALVSLPAGMDAKLGARLGTGLDRLGIPFRMIPSLPELIARAGRPASCGAPSLDHSANVAAFRSPAAPPASDVAARVAAIDPAVLIGRTHFGLDGKAVGAMIRGKRVLITGAGGSIGSELARVAAGFAPDRIILMERAENALFNIDHQLGRRFPSVARSAVLHDVVRADETADLLARFKPDVVFHAAAHKHVPLMEDHPAHAVENNFFGTKAIADAAVAASVGRVVLISTDKAVNPTSVMGATKRLAELYIAGLAAKVGSSAAPGAGTRLSIVRFGNVLASACSVVPIWTAQLLEGGPITVTDPRMTRFFMTIPEAATLVAQAAALSTAPGFAPVYVLDMGEPVRILDLAIRLARLLGLEPRISNWVSYARQTGLGPEIGTDPTVGESVTGGPEVPIVLSGVRPGEKLFEQLAYAAENLAPTSHPGINCWRGTAASDSPTATLPNPDQLAADFANLRLGTTASRAAVLATIRAWVPELRADADAAPAPLAAAPKSAHAA